MKISSLICEFDPLHKGHKYLLDTIRKSGADCIIACMSGSFTQRGEPALFDKRTRTKAALICGADIVIELPVTFACSGAEHFAFGGTALLDSLGIADSLFFGSECGDISMIEKAAIAAEDNEVSAETKKLLSEGMTFAAAREKAVRNISGNETADIMQKPNNILGIEYVKALHRLKSGIIPNTICRIGADHDSMETDKSAVSASFIRELYISGGDISDYIPKPAAELFSGYTKAPKGQSRLSRLETVMLFRLRTMTKEELSLLPDISEGLENRIYKAVRSEVSIEGILKSVKAKRYPMARLKRALAHALLGITKEEYLIKPQYIRILGFNGTGRELLHEIKRRSSLPVISTLSKLPPLSEEGIKLLELESRCDDIYNLSGSEIIPCGENITGGIVTIM